MTPSLSHEQIAAMQQSLRSNGSSLSENEINKLLKGNFSRIRTSEKKIGPDGVTRWREEIVIH